MMGQQDIVMAPVVCPSLSRANVSCIMHLAGSIGGGAHLIVRVVPSRRERSATVMVSGRRAMRRVSDVRNMMRNKVSRVLSVRQTMVSVRGTKISGVRGQMLYMQILARPF